jgi:hypothetical protein
MKFVRKLAADAGGSEIAEAALVLPLLFLFLFGIIWFGQTFNIYTTIAAAAREGAKVAGKPACATCAAPACHWGSTNFPCDGTVDSTVVKVLQTSNMSTSAISAYSVTPALTPCPPPFSGGGCDPPTANNVTVCRSVYLNPDFSNAPQCGTVVSFQYTVPVYLPFTTFNLQQITLTAVGESAMEY